MAGTNLKDEANGTRLSRLLVNKGTEALRQTFDKYHPLSTLPTVLNTNQALLKKLRYKIITNDQWELLYPASGNPDSKIFDITLLSVLLRNICGLKHPATGWSSMPPDTDRSLEANLLRIKLYRNKIFAHVTTTGVSDSQLADLWPKISQTLNDLGILKTETDHLRTCPLSPEEENYIEVLKHWKLQDDELHEILDGIKVSATKILKTSDEIKESIPESTRELQKSITNESRGIKESIAVQTKEIEEIVKKQSESSSQPDLEENLLIQKLCKFNFDGEVKNSVRPFHPGTREWLFAKVEDWFSKKESNTFVLTAGPGVGKTVLAAKTICIYREKKSLAAYHFCKFNYSNYRNPSKMIESLASQLCDSVEGFETKLLEQLKRGNKVENLHDAFQVYLKEPLSQLPENKPMLVVIDGLDECQSDERTELLDVLAKEFSTLPFWLKVLVTSRPEIKVKKKLSSLEYMEILPNDKNNEEDIKQYLASHLPALSKKKVINSRAIKECEGSFLFAFYLQEHLQKSTKITKKEITSQLPRGISSVYHDYFSRLRKELEAVSKEYDIFHLLEIIAAAHGPIPLSFITELGLDRTRMKDIIGKVNENVSTLLFVNDDLVTVFHKSVVDWLKLTGDKKHKYTVDCEHGNELLWKISKERFEEIKQNIVKHKDLSIIDELEKSKAMKYALDNGFNHLPLPSAQSSWSTSVDYEWLVDVALVYNSLRRQQAYFTSRESEQWKDFLRPMSNDNPLTAIGRKICWYNKKFGGADVIMQDILNEGRADVIMQDILNEGPSEIFSDEEKDIAKQILNNYAPLWFEKLNPLHLTPNIHVTACAFSHDGSRLVICADDGRIHIWDIDSCKVVQNLSNDCKQAICCFWSDDILIFHYIGSELMLSRYLVNQGLNVEAEAITLATDKATPLAFSPKAFIYRCTNYSSIKVHRIAEANEISIPELYTMEKFAVTHDGSTILAADKDHFEIWNISGNTFTKCYSAKLEEFPLNDVWEAYKGLVYGLYHCSISIDQKYGIICFSTTREHIYPIERTAFAIAHIFLIRIDTCHVRPISSSQIQYMRTNIKDTAEIIREKLMCLITDRRITVYFRVDCEHFFSFNHDGYPDYYKGRSICRSGNIFALPQKSGEIFLVKLHWEF